MLRLDSSLVVSVLSQEALSAMSRAWMGEQYPELLAISDWTLAEVSSALALKVRTGVFTLEQRMAKAGTSLGVRTVVVA